MKFLRFIRYALAVTLTGPVWAQQKLTVEDAIRIALDHSSSLHASSMGVEYADARQREMETARLPKLKLNAAYQRVSEIDAASFSIPGVPNPITIAPSIVNYYNSSVSLQQPLFTGFRIENGIKAADYAAKASQMEFDRDKRALTYHVKAAYWNLYKARQVSAMVAENVEQVKAHLKDARNLLAQGLATQSDVLKVEVQLAGVELQDIDSRNAVRMAMIGFNNVIGLPLDTAVEPASEIRFEDETMPSLDHMVGLSANDHSEIRAMEYRVKAGEANVKAAKGGWYPQVALGANYYYSNPNQRIFPTRDQFRDTWDVALSVSFDIWNWGATGYQTHQARAQLEQMRDGLQMTKDRLSLEITQSYLNVQQAKERISVADKGVRLAQENYRITSEKFKNGFALSSDLLDAEVALLQARTNYTHTLVDFEIAKARLEQALGTTIATKN